MKKFQVYFLSVLLLVACTEKEDMVPGPGNKIFTLIADQNLQTSSSANWLIIHSIKGQLLFSKLFESGDTIVFETNDNIDDDKISITLFNYSIPRSYPDISFELTSYLQIPSGEVWTLRENAFRPSFERSAGTFNITATDIPVYATLALSDKLGNSYGFSLEDPYAARYKSTATRFASSLTFLMTTRDPQDNIRYKIFEDVKVNDNYTISYSEMSIPEKIMEVSFPQSDAVFLSVQAFDQDQPKTDYGYRLHVDYEFNTIRTKIKIGYMDRFQYYHTSLGIQNSKGLYQYDKSGAKAESINLPFDAIFSLTNESVGGFSFTANRALARRQSEWSYYSDITKGPVIGIHWIVNGPNDGEQRIGTFPSQFKNIYPDFKIEKLQHATSTFYLQGTTYSDLIESSFKDKTLPDEKEIYSVKVY